MPESENIKLRGKRREKKPPKKITEKYLYNSGLAYLQRFPASTPHFRRIMSRKIDRSCDYHKDQERETCAALLEATVESFTRMGLLNDSAYLQGMVNSYRRRGLSTQAIMAKLGQKGLAQDAILATIRAFDEDRNAENPELAAAILLMRRKRLGPFRKTSKDEKTATRELSSLARAGFGFDIAQKALSMTQEDADEVLRAIRD